MNKVLCLAFVLLFSIGAFAQEKTIDESEFTTILKNAMTRRENKSFRVKTSFQSTVEGKPEENNAGTTVMEFASPGMSRVVFQSNSKAQPRAGERIKINNKTYTRENGAAWKQDTTIDNQRDDERNAAVESNVVYKFLGSNLLNGKQANVYEKTENRKRISQKDNKEINSDVATKYWFSADGDLLKTERMAIVHIADKTLHIQVTKNYEMDASIKIETPQIAGSMKQ